MFFRLFAIFALVAVAFASPKPAELLTYAAPAAGVLPLTYSAYPAPVAYSAQYAAAPVPYAYSSYYLK
ncbi:hypothetical protein ABMA28_004616 [Loxostege sticticalis]|uniref:Neuropeptide-like 4 n=1 Tax=Loxostege sticticalis TaxID=481309 RepID=A0ABD0SSE8_LOXSC